MLKWGRDRRPRAEMDASLVLDLLDRLRDAGVSVWLDGGWGVDALLGTQTRAHDDLDVIVRLDDVRHLEHTLAGLGFVRAHGAPPTSFELTDAEGHQVDVHPVTFTRSGEGIYEMENGEEWHYPAGSLLGNGTILGREVACQTPAMQLLSHTTGYALDVAHRRDVTALSARVGLPLPSYESA